MKNGWLEHEARMERLARLAETIERGEADKYNGADYQLAYSFMIGEIIALQKDCNKRYPTEMAVNHRFAEFFDRLMQIIESSETVLMDSVDPAKTKQEKLVTEKGKGASAPTKAKPKATAKRAVAPTKGTSEKGRSGKGDKP